jgi:peptidoglycan hydrolase CwlO-like protein
MMTAYFSGLVQTRQLIFELKFQESFFHLSKQDKENIEDKVNRLDSEINSLKGIIKKLQSEKDELEGENLKMKQGIDMYKVRCLHGLF